MVVHTRRRVNTGSVLPSRWLAALAQAWLTDDEQRDEPHAEVSAATWEPITEAGGVQSIYMVWEARTQAMMQCDDNIAGGSPPVWEPSVYNPGIAGGFWLEWEDHSTSPAICISVEHSLSLMKVLAVAVLELEAAHVVTKLMTREAPQTNHVW